MLLILIHLQHSSRDGAHDWELCKRSTGAHLHVDWKVSMSPPTQYTSFVYLGHVAPRTIIKSWSQTKQVLSGSSPGPPAAGAGMNLEASFRLKGEALKRSSHSDPDEAAPHRESLLFEADT